LKRLIITSLILTLSSRGFTQEFQLFPRLGVNYAGISRNGERNLTKTTSVTSFQAGFMTHYSFNKLVGVQTSLLFTGKGAQVKSSMESPSTYFEATSGPYYLELPVSAVFNVPLKSLKSNFFGGAGPYVAVGIGGKNKADGVISGGMPFSVNNSINFDNESGSEAQFNKWAGMGYLKRLDYGLNATAGVMFDRLLLSINYGYGLTDINRTNFDYEDKYRHRVLSLTAGFRLK
jgi:hypothetical protein